MNDDGSPHLVPITFALDGDVLYTAVDTKPKRSRRLRRLDNIRRDPRVTVLVDHYDEDWSRLWWCRLEGLASIVDRSGPEALVQKYPTYRLTPPGGPVIEVRVHAWSGWAAALDARS